MTYAYWILAGVLALSNLFAGGTKLVRTKEEIESSGMGWAEDFSQRTIRGIGAAEVLGALGLILPPLTHIAPVLAPIAAIGLVVLQVLAAITHIRRHEPKVLAANVPLVILAGVVAVLGFMLWI